MGICILFYFSAANKVSKNTDDVIVNAKEILDHLVKAQELPCVLAVRSPDQKDGIRFVLIDFSSNAPVWWDCRKVYVFRTSIKINKKTKSMKLNKCLVCNIIFVSGKVF